MANETFFLGHIHCDYYNYTIQMNSMKSAEDLIMFISAVPFILALSIFGIISNSYSFVVISKWTRTGSTRFLFRTIFVADSLSFVVFVMRFTLPEIYKAFSALEGYMQFYRVYYRYIDACNSFMMTYSMYLVIILAVERYYTECTEQGEFSLKRAQLAELVMTLCDILLHSPQLFIQDTPYILDPCGDRFITPTEARGFDDTWVYRMYYGKFIMYLVNFILPLLLLWFPLDAIRRNGKRGEAANEICAEITHSVTVIAMLTFACRIPTLVYLAYEDFRYIDEWFVHLYVGHETVAVIVKTTNCFWMISSAKCFVLMFDRRFRKILKDSMKPM
jgi:hypothetical protein